jgi:hypothetical protein
MQEPPLVLPLLLLLLLLLLAMYFMEALDICTHPLRDSDSKCGQ